MPKRVNCFKCRHFYITWEKYFQRGCRAHAIKTMDIPSVVVRRISGLECQSFEPREKKGRASGAENEGEGEQ